MKKVLLTAVAAFYSVALFAQQAPATPTQGDDAPKPRTETPKPKKEKKAKKAHKPEHEGKDSDEGDKVKADNHDQAVQTVAQSTELTGADKGAAVSAVASAKRQNEEQAAKNADRRAARSARKAEHKANGAKHRSARAPKHEGRTRPETGHAVGAHKQK
ncbi:hypothetical protein PK28_06925 [Hymenobacter sp. DG25B]|uniref:hypothetical protein n=1 Tax=Hymenobacter sp. DG25B TaxID=1385664 RepID=UPI00054130F2|nr:hypothetical protein [Hymenobacter sp. DG25B]AIZ63491.1 hypothetical protein PK28_06925 [Hymenobacter sp. DG25B]